MDGAVRNSDALWVLSLEKCDFGPIIAWVEQEREKKKVTLEHGSLCAVSCVGVPLPFSSN